MKSSKACIFYIALWILYYLQGTLYPTGSIVSQSVLMLALLLSFYYVYKTIATYRLPVFLKVLNLFLVVLTVYGIVYIISGNTYYIERVGLVPKYYYLKNIYLSLLPIYSFYYFTKVGAITDRWIRWLSLIFILLAVSSFYKEYANRLQAAVEFGSQQEEFTNNSGYTFCALLPLLFFWKNKPWIQYTLLFVCTLFIVMAMKRGAILIAALCIIYFLYKNLAAAGKRQRLTIIFISAIAIVVSVYFVMNFIESSEYFKARIEQTIAGNSSERDVIFSKLIDYYLYYTSGFQFFFGGGAEYTIKISENYAHNDWLELLINNGLFGAIIYISYFIALKSDASTLHRQQVNDCASALTMTWGILFLSTLFSMSYASLTLASRFCLGYCLANINYTSR